MTLERFRTVLTLALVAGAGGLGSVVMGYAQGMVGGGNRFGDRFAPMGVHAQTNASMDKSHGMKDGLGMPGFAKGEVRKVDEVAGKLTLRHAGMESLDMPPMTMVFRVRNPAWLHDLRVGDKVYFRADRVAGYVTVTTLERKPAGSP
jgi:Cu(I)/Ag(I) efflux system protein CusF